MRKIKLLRKKRRNMKLNQFFKLFLLLFLTACVSEFDEREIDYKKEFESLLKNFENSSILNFEKESIENLSLIHI